VCVWLLLCEKQKFFVENETASGYIELHTH